MRRVLVTGGGSGIGRAVARSFAQAGAAVTICGRRMDALRETDAGRGMACLEADITDEAEVAAVFATPFDVVVANAGGGTAGLVRDTRLEDWTATLSVNLTGTFLTFRAALQSMGTGGRLIAVASTAAVQGTARVAAYAAAKHGVMGLVRSLALEVAKEGITCNAVCPGFVDTPLTDRSVANVQAALGLSEDDARRRIARGNPVGRMIDPEEVAQAVLYLASPGAAMVNGHALMISGGEV